MKIPLFSKLTAKSRGRKVVRASARAMRGGEEDYYEAEPNMKLSHAFMVVLILHVVAVGGIYAFNHIKVNKSPDLIANFTGRLGQAAGGTAAAAPSATPVQAVERQPGDADDPLPVMAEAPVTAAPAASVPAAAPQVGTAAPPKAAAPASTAPAAPAAAAVPAAPASVPETYRVEKGDNPYNIAKKFGVSYQEMLALNNIEDPTKLQIGQVLKLPRRAN